MSIPLRGFISYTILLQICIKSDVAITRQRDFSMPTFDFEKYKAEFANMFGVTEGVH